MSTAHVIGVLPDDIETVVFLWSNKKGHCYECGLPAAYWLRDAHPSLEYEERLRCSVCAAGAAADGETIEYLWSEDFA